MPVSRKRKSRKPKPVRKQPAAGRITGPGPGFPTPREAAGALADLAKYRQQLNARRAEVAAEVAAPIVAELITQARNQTDEELEQILCDGVGAALWRMEELPPGEAPSPETVGMAVLNAAAEAVRSALDTTVEVSASWRVLSLVIGILPYPVREEADEVVRALADGPGRPLRLWAPAERELAGPALWTRDVYGSRFAIIAPFLTSDGGQRWYLWDIDACGHQAITVHSAFCPGPDVALASWRDGVGETAAGEAAFTPVDDPALAADVLFRADGILRLGGENEAQLAEYLRSRRLAQSVVASLGPRQIQPSDLNAENADREFGAWLRKHRTPPVDLGELATELAASWSLDAPEALYGTCSPHRVALIVTHVLDYYEDDFANEVLDLLPDWISWLAERNGTPAELADRCLPYASGEPYPGLIGAGHRSDYHARVAE
jgi:hypothetical protein